MTTKDDRLLYQHQTILTSERLEISNIESNTNVSIFERIRTANQDNEKCESFRQAIKEKRRFFNRISFQRCTLENNVLYNQQKF